MNESYEVLLSAEAEEDIDRAWAWISQSDPVAADRWRDRLLDVIDDLAKLPLRFPRAPEARLRYVEEDVRQRLYGSGYWKYRILFLVVGKIILVLGIRHGARRYLGEEIPDDEDLDCP